MKTRKREEKYKEQNSPTADFKTVTNNGLKSTFILVF